VVAVLAAALCCTMLIGATDASASAKGIKQAIRTYIPKIDEAEGHVLSAIGEYKEKPDPALVEEALNESVSVVRALEAKVAKQSARSPRVRKGKAKTIAGLKAIVRAYQHLATAYADKAPAPVAAKAEAEASVRAVKRGVRELAEGAKLLKHA
jgi:hypothetical protein